MKESPCIYLKVPLETDLPALLSELAICLEASWSPHFNTKDYSGDWTSIALYSPSGNASDILTHGNEKFRPTALLDRCPYFKSLIDSLLFEKESVRLLRLAPGSQVHTHSDLKAAYEFGNFRLHIPIITSEAVDFIVGGHKIEMKAGECWYANFDQPHSVDNHGDKERVHLVIDGLRNEWTDTLFREAGYDFDLEAKLLAPDEETVRRMIAELSNMQTDSSRELIRKLEESIRKK